MRIGLLTSLTQVNSIYRGLPILTLQERGHEVVPGMDGSRLQLDRLRGCDVLHIHRHHDVAAVRRAVGRLRTAGSAIVWDNDDDLRTMPEGIDLKKAEGALRSQQARADMVAMVRLADVVTTPSSVLAEQYRAWGAAHVAIVENFIPETYAADAGRPPHEGVTIGWTAGAEHRYDYVTLGLRETLLALLERHPQLHVMSIGIDLGLPHGGYRHRSLVQHEELASHVAAFDIGIAPIADIPFNAARSNVKVKEYAAAGVPWLASPIGPYAGLGERHGGELVPDSGWEAALDRLIRDARRRRKLARQGRKWAQSQTVARNIGAWEDALTLAVRRAATACAR
jgi:hypothetical protein